MTPYFEISTSGQGQESNGGTFLHSPVPTEDTGSISSPPPLRRRRVRPFLRHDLILNLAETHPLPTLWSPHHDGREQNPTVVRSPIPFTTLVDIMDSPHWSDTEDDDNESEYDGDDESEEREAGDDVAVYLVESPDNIIGLASIVTPLPQVEGDPTTDFEDETRGETPQTTTSRNDTEAGFVILLSSSEDDMDGNCDDDSGDSSSNSQVGETPLQQYTVVHQQQQRRRRQQQRPNVGPAVRLSRRHSLHNEAFDDEARGRAMMYFGHRRHSMGDIIIAA